ncbi:MAG: DUF4349 domain-containing protein [Marivirga sp.]|nr:DUF4349 domain-containing protein [Marivirga sp.]
MKVNTIVLVLVLFVSCSERRSKLAIGDSESVAGFDAVAVNSPEKDENAIPLDRKLIKDGSLSFETGDLKKTQSEIAGISKSLKGYASNETLNNAENRTSCQITIRVPASQFEELVEKLEKIALKVEHKSIQTRDVTEEFFDAEARLKTKREVESRYRELLKKAQTVEDMLAIERETGNVRTEIETIEGKLNYLKNQVAFSTLEVHYYQVVGTGFGFGGKFGHSVANGWNNLLVFLIGLTNIWPFLILFSAIGWWLKRWLSKKPAQQDKEVNR